LVGAVLLLIIRSGSFFVSSFDPKSKIVLAVDKKTLNHEDISLKSEMLIG
jgi:hypothetical protein